MLYRSRTGISLYEQAFRAAGIPIEPAGRGMLAAGREVQDVLALLRWLVWPEDDVALAAVLRSPIMRLPEDALHRLLAARGLFREGPDGRLRNPAGLWPTLRAAAADDAALEASSSTDEASAASDPERRERMCSRMSASTQPAEMVPAKEPSSPTA